MSAAEVVLTVYEKPTCTTCRNLFRLLIERGVDFERVNYIVDPLSAVQIRELLTKAGLRPRDVVRLKEPGARELPLEDDEAVLAALEAHPELLQRPIVVRGDRAVLARPPERVLELL
jgi:arsenate reductase (glutaredoxin)